MIFVISSLVMVAAALIAFRTPVYRALSQTYRASAPPVEETTASAAPGTTAAEAAPATSPPGADGSPARAAIGEDRTG